MSEGEVRYALDIKWAEGALPTLVGPFRSRSEADQWARVNAPNGSSVVRVIADPYQQTEGR